MTFAMKTRSIRLAAAALLALAWTADASAQEFETLGTRAAGMGGAFVAVADDASAVFWNPAGLAAGSFFSLVDRPHRPPRSTRADDAAGSRSSVAHRPGRPALGLSYYRLRTPSSGPCPLTTGGSAAGRNNPGAAEVRLDTLVTHHAGVDRWSSPSCRGLRSAPR